MAYGKFIAYYRVSTARQGRSGLGLEAQQQAVRDYLNGGAWELVGEFTEVESGRNDDRAQLKAALAACRAHRATLVIAKLDRLARNVAFVSALMEAGVDFVAADFPQANRLTIHILAAVAEHEARVISERTKAALAAAKARGQKIGGYRPGAEERARAIYPAGQRGLQAAAARRAADVLPVVEQIRAAGVTSAKGIARELNARGVPSPRGGQWQTTSVQRLLARVAAG